MWLHDNFGILVMSGFVDSMSIDRNETIAAGTVFMQFSHSEVLWDLFNLQVVEFVYFLSPHHAAVTLMENVQKLKAGTPAGLKWLIDKVKDYNATMKVKHKPHKGHGRGSGSASSSSSTTKGQAYTGDEQWWEFSPPDVRYVDMIMVSLHKSTYEQLLQSTEFQLEGRVAYSRHWKTAHREPIVRRPNIGLLAQNEVNVTLNNFLFQKDYSQMVTALQDSFRDQIMKLSPELKALHGIPEGQIQMTLVPNPQGVRSLWRLITEESVAKYLCLKLHCLTYVIENIKCSVQFSSQHVQLNTAQIQDRFRSLCLTDKTDEGELPPQYQQPGPMPQQHQQQPAQQQQQWPNQHQQQPAQQQQQLPQQHQQQPVQQQQQLPQQHQQHPAQQQQQVPQPAQQQQCAVPVPQLFNQQPLTSGLMTQAQPMQTNWPNAASPMNMSTATVSSSWTAVTSSLDETMMRMQ